MFVISIVVIAALQLFLNRTKLGRAFRATSDDREAAELMGINNRHIYALAMAIALAIVARRRRAAGDPHAPSTRRRARSA